MDGTKKEMEYREEWHDKWMKFLAPLVGAAVTALGVYATAAQQSYSHRNNANVEVIESQIKELESLKADVKELSRNVYVLIGEIRSQQNRRK